MTLQELKDKISIITNETQKGANTAQRVGSTMQDIASFVPSYPVVTIKDNFTIDAEPNTFYNIKNSGEDSVNINIDSANYSVEDKEKLTMFVWDNWREDLGNNDLDMLLYSISLGHHIKEDNTQENYKYSSHQLLEMNFTEEDSGQIITYKSQMQVKSYFSDEVKTGNNINWCIKQFIQKEQAIDEDGNVQEEYVEDLIESLGQDIIIPITNIQVLTDNNDDLAIVTLPPYPGFPHVLVEVENDSSEFSHKYEALGFVSQLMIGIQYVYTNESVPNTTDIYMNVGEGEYMNLSEQADIKFIKNIPIKGCEVANEYVFNINSPANVTFNQSIKWNNGNEPDLSQNGIYTISLLNGVGCFTFVE